MIKTCRKDVQFVRFLILLAAGLIAVQQESMAKQESYATVSQCRKASCGLRCEWLVKPAGIDVTKPRLSWVNESESRGWKQGAYEILVADSERKLKEDKGELWSSGKVSSDQSVNVVYKGRALQPHTQCFWKVRVWDETGKISGWSEPSEWTMGPLKQQDWGKAVWIGAPTVRVTNQQAKELFGKLTLDGCNWICYPQGKADFDELSRVAETAPAETCYFKRLLNISKDRKITRAQAIIYADAKFVFFANGQQAGKSQESTQEFQRPNMHEIIDFTSQLVPGRNILGIAASNEKGPAGLAAKFIIEYENAERKIIITDKNWQACKTDETDLQKADFKDGRWKAVKVPGAMGIEPWGWLGTDMQISGKLYLPPSPFLRKEFKLKKNVSRAVAYVTALGLYELRINGKKVGGDFFTPGWTDYNKRVYYNTYDVTDLVNQNGKNAVGAILADGWYAGYIGFGKFVGFPKSREFYGPKPLLKLHLRVEYSDGSVDTIVTDKTWKVTTLGPVREADLLMGQTYDARMEMPDWDKFGFDDSNWQKVFVKDKIQAQVQAYPSVTVRETAELKPVELTEPQKGVFVFNMGQNFAGFARLKVQGQAGTKIVLRFGEMRHENGMIMTENLRQARATDTYILKGDGVEIWQPQFTFHGFQYVEVTGLRYKPSIDDVTGIVVNSDMPVAGRFECSNPIVNKLYSNITWTQRANSIDIPTDCPQRDERLGWTGDAVNFVRSATFNMDTAAFFTKWLTDLQDSQHDDGAYPNFAPEPYPWGPGPDSPAWSDAGIICPYFVYRAYGDTRVIEKNYDGMVRFMDYQLKRSDNFIRPPAGHGDWLSIKEQTPNEVTATAFFAYDAQLIAEMAAAIGKDADARKYTKLAEDIKQAFDRAFVSEDGKIKGDSQTCYALAINMNLLPEEKRQLAANNLVERIEKNDWHLATGFVGLRNLLPALTKAGRTDVAYRLLNNTTYPSWGYSIVNGATTIWERWDSWTKEKGFQSPGMNSFCHYSLGSVCEWMFDTVGGISTDGPGYKKIIIRPRPGGLDYAKVSYVSIYGTISTNWTQQEDSFKLDVTIPANTTATVYIPAGELCNITENGGCAKKAQGVKFLREEDGASVFQIGSGSYHFAWQVVKKSADKPHDA